MIFPLPREEHGGWPATRGPCGSRSLGPVLGVRVSGPRGEKRCCCHALGAHGERAPGPVLCVTTPHAQGTRERSRAGISPRSVCLTSHLRGKKSAGLQTKEVGRRADGLERISSTRNVDPWCSRCSHKTRPRPGKLGALRAQGWHEAFETCPHGGLSEAQGTPGPGLRGLSPALHSAAS